MTPEARAKLREGIDEIYREFVSRVAEGRKKKWEEIAPLAEGRAWLGSQARQNGLVDELGGIDKSIELLRKRAGIKADERLELVPYPPRRSIFDQYLRSTTEQGVETRLRQLLGFDYRVWAQGGMMRIMPYTIDIR